VTAVDPSVDVLAAQVREMRAFAQKYAEIDPDFGPLFFRDVVRLCDDVAALVARVTEAEQQRDENWRGYEEMRHAWVEKNSALADARNALERATNVAEMLWMMVDRETWRDTGGDDGQGHYEGDYRAEKLIEEIRSWREVLARLDGSSDE
jgi:hypothetical protein